MTDILCNEDGEVICLGGDFVIGESTIQHQADILTACEGEYKQFPTCGVGLSGFLNDEDRRPLVRKIRIQLTSDKMLVSAVSFKEVLRINATY